MRIPCKCGGVCDDYGDGTECDGQVLAIGDSPCPRHRCEAHRWTLGMTIALTIAPEEERR